jgi:hypothetical protein
LQDLDPLPLPTTCPFVHEDPVEFNEQAIQADYNPHRIVYNAQGGEELAYRCMWRESESERKRERASKRGDRENITRIALSTTRGVASSTRVPTGA